MGVSAWTLCLQADEDENPSRTFSRSGAFDAGEIGELSGGILRGEVSCGVRFR